jgi:uncharacterized protein YndB with AHSA1/START domain
LSEYAFLTEWQVAAPPEAVWDAITLVDDWPRWWKGVLAVEHLRDGDGRGVGTVHRHRWRSRLPYELTFEMETTLVEPVHRLEGLARGDLAGTGAWTFTPTRDGTHVSYDWRVFTTKRWMSFVAPFARPLFVWNHDTVMRWGAEGLARRLGASVKAG